MARNGKPGVAVDYLHYCLIHRRWGCTLHYYRDIVYSTEGHGISIQKAIFALLRICLRIPTRPHKQFPASPSYAGIASLAKNFAEYAEKDGDNSFCMRLDNLNFCCCSRDGDRSLTRPGH
jgi:hypothetical protein